MRITRLPRAADTRPRTWTPVFVWFRLLKIEQDKTAKRQWGLVVLDTMEHRYSETHGRMLWRFPK